MSWQDDAIIEQERADALWTMGEAEWRDLYDDKEMKGDNNEKIRNQAQRNKS